MSNKGKVKDGDRTYFCSDTIEIIDNKDDFVDDDFFGIEVCHSRKVSPVRFDILQDDKEQLKKANKLSVIRKLIGSKSARMSSRKVLGILVSPHSFLP